MPDYNKLREMVSHRATFEFDTGAKVVGYIASCAPAQGPVQLLVLSKVQLLDSSSRIGWRKLPLKIGISNGQRTEVIEGLKEGNKLVLP